MPLGGLGFGIVGLGRWRSRVGCSAWRWLEGEEELAGDDDESVSDKTLNETLWTWTADQLHVLCTIPECEEDQGMDVDVDVDVEGPVTGMWRWSV